MGFGAAGIDGHSSLLMANNYNIARKHVGAEAPRSQAAILVPDFPLIKHTRPVEEKYRDLWNGWDHTDCTNFSPISGVSKNKKTYMYIH